MKNIWSYLQHSKKTQIKAHLIGTFRRLLYTQISVDTDIVYAKLFTSYAAAACTQILYGGHKCKVKMVPWELKSKD